MTFTQLEYIVAVDTFRHFAEAAAHCFVTQPTLSMQIHKLEEELGVKIFDRSKQPVLPTEPGLDIIDHARKILAERDILTDMLASKKGVVNGELKIGVIPTLAPYLLPLFIPAFTKKYANVKLVVNELTTDVILSRLREGRIDAGVLVTPLNEKGVKEDVLFYEEMLAYVSQLDDRLLSHDHPASADAGSILSAVRTPRALASRQTSSTTPNSIAASASSSTTRRGK